MVIFRLIESCFEVNKQHRYGPGDESGSRYRMGESDVPWRDAGFQVNMREYCLGA